MYSVRSSGERWSARRSHKVVVRERSLVLIGGFARGSGSSSEVWVAACDGEDGVLRWRLACGRGGFGPRDGHAAVCLGPRVYVLGGFYAKR